jgi:photosystem II stability/assembly factor-like uncharacterized protein
VALTAWVAWGREGQAASRWEAIGPEGGSVVALAADAGDPHTLYAGVAEGGVWRSADGGLSWSAAIGNLPPGTLRSLIADPEAPGTLYLGRGSDGIWKSGDGGRSWAPVATALGGAPADVRVLRFDPASGALWAGLAPRPGQASLYRSPGGTGPWVPVDLGAPDLTVTALAFGGGAAFAGTVTGGVLRGSATGESWVPVLPGLSVSSLAWGGGRLYAATGSGFWVTRDQGANWTLLIVPPPVIPQLPPNRLILGALAVDPRDPDLFYLGYRLQRGFSPPVSGLYRSRDGGASVESVAGGYPDFDPAALLFDPAVPGRLLAGPGPLGVWSSPDGVSGWRSGNRGLRAGSASRVLADPKRPAILYAGGTDRGLVRTLDGGATWQTVNGGGAIDDPRALDPEQPATIYAFGNAATGPALFKSRNGGRSWAVLLGDPLSFALDPRRPKTLFAGGAGGRSNPIFRSDDGGLTWQQGVVGCTFPFHLAVAPTGEVYTGGSSFCGIGGTVQGGVDRSDDGGKTFVNRRDGLPAIPVPSALAVDPRRPATLYGGFHGAILQVVTLTFLDRVFRSRDRADHWEAVAGLAALQAPALDFAFPPVGPNTIWVASGGQGIWRSGDAGATFRPVATPGLPTATVFDLEFDRQRPATLYAATPGGLFRLVDE